MKTVIHLVIIISIILTLAPAVLADEDHIDARRLSEAGEILAFEEIIRNIRRDYPGTIIEVELEWINEQIVYEIEILNKQGYVNKIYLDARTADVLDIENDH